MSFAYLPEVTHFFAGASGRFFLVEDGTLALLVFFLGCFSTFVRSNVISDTGRVLSFTSCAATRLLRSVRGRSLIITVVCTEEGVYV